MSARSYLYVPGDQAERIAKADARGADALILDLEDAVAPAAKDDARGIVADAIGRLQTDVWVRVNAGERTPGGIAAIIREGLHGIVLAKTDSPDTLAAVDEIIGSAEDHAGLPRGRVRVCPLVESARGMLAIERIAAGPRVTHLALGEADLSADLGIVPSDEVMRPLRMQAVVASAAAGIDAPTAPVSIDFQDLDALRASTIALRDAGFGARAAIHPAQVAVINEVFTPTDEEVALARDVLARFEAAGRGVTLDADGRMLDEALVRSARRTLLRARTGP